MPEISKYVAVGKDEPSLKRLTEHLPYAFSFVTTPAAINAQQADETLFLVDDVADAGVLKSVADCPHAVWLLAAGTQAPGGFSIRKPMKLAQLVQVVAQACGAGTVALSVATRFIPERRLLVGSAGEIALTEREASLLSYLAKQRGNPVGREELFRNVWGFSAELDTHTLETHIYRLRGKLAEVGEKAAMIETAEGGYKLV